LTDFTADFIYKNFLKIITAILIIIAFIFVMSPFLIPLVFGGILAMAFSPYVDYCLNKGMSRRISVFFISLLIFILGLGPATIVLIKGAKILTKFFNGESAIMNQNLVKDKIYVVLDKFAHINNIEPSEIHDKFNNIINSIGNWSLKVLSNVVTEIPNIAMLSFVTVLAFYFFLVDEAFIRKWFDRFFNFTNSNGDKFVSLLKSSCHIVLFTNGITGLIQASIITAGAYFCDAGDVFVIFVCTFFLSFIPVIGAGPVGFLLAALTFLEGRIGAGTAMIIISLFAGIADNLIRPYLSSGGENHVPIFVSFLSILGGVYFMGPPGLFIGPLLSLLMYGALPIILDDYLLSSTAKKENTNTKDHQGITCGKVKI
jgi:predicted PurR-regulated permease PerM